MQRPPGAPQSRPTSPPVGAPSVAPNPKQAAPESEEFSFDAPKATLASAPPSFAPKPVGSGLLAAARVSTPSAVLNHLPDDDDDEFVFEDKPRKATSAAADATRTGYLDIMADM